MNSRSDGNHTAPGSIRSLARYVAVFLIQSISAVTGHLAPHAASPLALPGTAGSDGTAGYLSWGG